VSKQPIIYSGLVEGILHFAMQPFSDVDGIEHFAMQPFSDEPSTARVAYWRDTNGRFSFGIGIDRHRRVYGWFDDDAEVIAWLLDDEVPR